MNGKLFQDELGEGKERNYFGISKTSITNERRELRENQREVHPNMGRNVVINASRDKGGRSILVEEVRGKGIYQNNLKFVLNSNPLFEDNDPIE